MCKGLGLLWPEAPSSARAGLGGTQNLGGAGLAAGLAVLGGEHWKTLRGDLGMSYNSNWAPTT